MAHSITQPLFATGTVARLATALLLSLVWTTAVVARPAPEGRAQDIVDQWARKKALKGTSVGVSAVCTADGAVWAARDAETPRYTASVAKLLTTAAAIESFPADVSWPTTLHGEVDDSGVIAGELTLVGRGDPQLMPDDLEALADQLVALGVKQVSGDLVVDTSRFAGALLPPGYDIKRTDAAYRPNISAAGSNYGAIVVAVRPGRAVGKTPRVTVSPASGAQVVVNEAKTVDGKRSNRLTVATRAQADGRTRVVIGGEIGVGAKRIAVRKRVADPGLASGYLLRAFLKKRDVSVAGAVRVETKSTCRSTSPRLAAVESASLADTLRDMNTWSNNSMAETVFKHLGVDDSGSSATWARAQRAVTGVVTGSGAPADQVEIVNGSGLYLATKISPRAMTRVLSGFAGDDEEGAAFRGSLAVAGETGTLKWRLRREATRGKVRAKTGTLDEVVSIAGYAPTASGCTLAFAIFVNDASDDRTSALRREVDKLILSLASL